MEKYPFIFSNRFPYRLQRHLIFWLSWWLFAGFLYSFSSGILNISYWQRLPISLTEAFIYLIPHTFLSYSLMYFTIPRFLLKGNYIATLISVLCLFVLTGALSSVISVYLLGTFRYWVLGEVYVPPHINEINFYLGLLSGLRGGITIGGIAAAIKLMKYWYTKEQRNLQLQKENISSQLQLLKAQVHPHFLFNTLNNIYANTQASSPQASKMIMGLSQLLRYMLYECNQPLVLLTRELKMLEEYVELEKSRYGNELDVHIEMPTEETGLAIAPLLLLPFVENSFKHGASKMLDQPWISLEIAVEDDWLKMKLLNGKTEEEASATSGIGLSNVKKRLELLYPGTYDLQVANEEEVFIVNFKMQLEKMAGNTNFMLSNAPAPAYA